MTATVELITTRSLGDNSYLVVSGDEAALVDPQRDIWPVLRSCESRKIGIRYVLETHVHNDYVSGAQEVRALAGALLVAPAKGRYAFTHLPVVEGDELGVGDVRLRAMETPGHTPEHMAYALLETVDEAPTVLFSGGSLMVGSAGRTDLLGPDKTDELTRAQFRTLRRLGTLPDETAVLPTHGAGSFCASGGPKGLRTSTIGDERGTNPAMRIPDEDTFVRERLRGLPRHPAYYAHMASINRAGADVLHGLPVMRPLTPDAVAETLARNGWIVDGRDRGSFAAAHIAGSVNVELDEAFANYVGWIVPFDTPIAFVLPEPEADSAVEATVQLLRIGYDHRVGYLRGGIEQWAASGRPVRSYPISSVAGLARRFDDAGPFTVLDVRQPVEWEHGTIPGSTQTFVADLPSHLPPRGREIWTICATGRRAALAASVLDRMDVPVTAVTSGGVDEFLELLRPMP